MNPFLAALATFIQPAINYVEQKLESIGAAFLGAFGAILHQFTNDQRQIGANVTAFWQAHYHANLAAGMSEIEALEKASTAALNEFAAEEKSEASKIVMMVTSAMEISVTNSLKTP